MAIQPKNLWKAWISTFLGLFIGALTTVTTWLVEDKFDWKAFAVSIVIAVIMAFTDLLKELQKEIDPVQTYGDSLDIRTVYDLPRIGEYGVWYYYNGQYYYWSMTGWQNAGSIRPTTPPADDRPPRP